MKRSILLILLGVVLVALGQLAARDGVWAAPGQSPERQSYPSMTPTSPPGAATDTPPPAAPTDTPPPSLPTDTPGVTPSVTISASTFTPTPSPEESSPTTQTSPTTTLTPASTDTPTELPQESGTETVEAEPTATPSDSDPETELEDTPTAPPEPTPHPSATMAQAVEKALQPTTTIPSPTPQSADILETLGQEWLLFCGLGLILLALLLFVLGYLLGRRGEE